MTQTSFFQANRLPGVTMLDAGELPIEHLASLAQREGRRPVPIYHAHRWFARRFSSVFRALLVAATLPHDGDFWDAFYNGVDLSSLTVLDPFVGGGTSVVEAARLGASTLGVDIDPVACAISRFELGANNVPDLNDALTSLAIKVGKRLMRYYRTIGPHGEPRRILHAFWVQLVCCAGCGQDLEAHPHYQLAYEAEGNRQWCFCRHCHHIHELPQKRTAFQCEVCREETVIAEGMVSHGALCCPWCSTTEPLISVAARTASKPRWKLFALETIPDNDTRRKYTMADRAFQTATAFDHQRLDAAQRALRRRRTSSGWRCIPDRKIPREGRADNRLLHYGYDAYHELFNPRQLLHLSVLGEAIHEVQGLSRHALALAFSDHLATNCMLTYYAFGWRRIAPLFTIRAFRHVSRPVEINPWLDGTGRGTFPNAVRQVQRAIDFARAPEVAHLDGGFVQSGSLETTNGQQRTIIRGDSQDLSMIPDHSVDLILTDPPYFDNIAYSELADFFLPWLQAFGLVPQSTTSASALPPNLAARSRGSQGYAIFRAGLTACFVEMRRVLRNGGRLIFSFQHQTPKVWEALASALGRAGWRPIQVFPMVGNSTAGLHQYDGTITWDAVTVCRKERIRASESLRIGQAAISAAQQHVQAWTKRLGRLEHTPFRKPDQHNLLRAVLVAAALGMFEVDGQSQTTPLQDVLESSSER
jgi:putative DNA methylase